MMSTTHDDQMDAWKYMMQLGPSVPIYQEKLMRAMMGTMTGAPTKGLYAIADDIVPPPPKVIARYSQYSNGDARIAINDSFNKTMYHTYKEPFFVPLKYVDAVMMLNAAADEKGSARIDGLGSLTATPDYTIGLGNTVEVVEARHYMFYF